MIEGLELFALKIKDSFLKFYFLVLGFSRGRKSFFFLEYVNQTWLALGCKLGFHLLYHLFICLALCIRLIY